MKREITLRVMILTLCLTALLAIANTYLALKIGILTSASIPAAMISMSILRFFKNATIYENNLVQTAASAGEAVAGGIVYSVPALIIIGFWQQFDYWQNFAIALIGGVLGILFSVPLRRVLVTEPSLNFPEAQAITQVLKINETKLTSLRELFISAFIAGSIEFLQNGLRWLSSQFQYWIKLGKTIVGFGVGFSPALIGAGFLIGFETCVSIFLGASLGFLFGIPILSHFNSHLIKNLAPQQAQSELWAAHLSYFAISAMVISGLLLLGRLLKPLYSSIKQTLTHQPMHNKEIQAHERDLPMYFILGGVVVSLIANYFLLNYLLPLNQLDLLVQQQHYLILLLTAYLLVFGFIFCALTGYFSGLVGVSASPGSAILIASLIIASMIVQAFFHLTGSHFSVQAVEAVIIIISSILISAAAISNDNMQDLKVGHLIQATPWKQQVMLLVGVVIASFIVPWVMQLLFNAYGVAGHSLHGVVDPLKSLPAPPAAAIAGITRSIFEHHIPWEMLIAGLSLVLIVEALNLILKKKGFQLSSLGIALGIYLPLSTSIPLFIGGTLAKLVHRKGYDAQHHQHRSMLIACGLMTGSILVEVILTLLKAFDIEIGVSTIAESYQVIASSLITLGLCYWIYQRLKTDVK